MKETMSKLEKVSLILLSATILWASSAVAKEAKFEVSIDKERVALGDTVQMGLTFYETQSMPAPDIGNLDGLETRYVGPSTMMTVINGRVSKSITHMYMVRPLRTGKFQLGPFNLTFKGDSYSSNSVSLEVAEERITQPTRAGYATAESLDLGDKLFLALESSKVSAYVFELVPVTVKMYVYRLNVRDIQLPTFAQEAFSKAEFKEPRQYRENVNGLTYDVLEFKTNIFATRPGEYMLGPAKIKCNVIVQKSRRGPDDFFDRGPDDSFFEDFMSRYERHPVELKTREAPLIVKALPSDGRPADFAGTVGDFQFIFNASPTKLKVGDPISLTMEINGTGNFNTVLVPKLDNTDGFKVYEPQIKTGQNNKTFVQVLIPESEQITQSPKATFMYFDPNKKQYKTITQGPVPLTVEKGKDEGKPQVVGPAASPAGRGQEDVGKRDIIYIKDSVGRLRRRDFRLYDYRVLLTLLVAPLLFLLVFYVIVQRSERLRTDSIYAGRLKAIKIARSGFKGLKRHIKRGEVKEFYEGLFGALQDYFGNRLNVPSAGITHKSVEEALRPKDIDINISRKLENLFSVCDITRFAKSTSDDLKMKDDLRELEEIVKYFERIRL